jgi:ArsR family transcriptional regulator
MIDMTRKEKAELEAHAGSAASLLRALAHEARLMVLCQLAEGERSAGDLAADTEMSQSAFSQHLAKLREEGLVATRREGTSIFYRISDPAALAVIGALAAHYCKPARRKRA